MDTQTEYDPKEFYSYPNPFSPNNHNQLGNEGFVRFHTGSMGVSKPELSILTLLWKKFMKKYKDYIFVGKEFKVDKISGEDLAETCRVNTNSAAGLDGWLPSDLALLSDKGFEILAEFLNMIEEGAPWPTSSNVARAVFLPS
mgnify:CR=1 FL=1